LSVYATTIPDLGTAGSFAVLAGSTVTNTGASELFGNLGVSPGTAITGFGPGIVNDGTIYAGGSVPSQAQADLASALATATSAPCATSLSGQDLGGLTLTPGVYCFASSAQLSSQLILNAQGDPNALFIIQIGSTLTTAAASSVVFADGEQSNNVFWQVGSSATLGANTQFAGNILALTSITLTSRANLQCGSALAINGAVTMDTNIVSSCGAQSSAVPEPTTASFFGLGLFMCSIAYIRRSTLARNAERLRIAPSPTRDK
jgi:type VI secretion system secreted protein VgrG